MAHRTSQKSRQSIADKNRFVEDYYRKQSKNQSIVGVDKMVPLHNRVLGKNAKTALLRRNGVRIHTKNCSYLIHKASDDYLKKLAKKTIINMHLSLLNRAMVASNLPKEDRKELSVRVMPKHIDGALELMNYKCLI